MSDIQGTPERVWALVRLLAAHDGALPRDAVRTWMDPFDSDPKGTALANTIGAASSLNFVTDDSASAIVRLTLSDVPGDTDGFADRVHDRLAETAPDHGDSVVLEVLAWFIARSAKEKTTTWIADGRSTAELCNLIRSDIRVGDDDKRFNQTRYPRWRDWMCFTGLGLDVQRSGNASTFYPYVTERIARILPRLAADFSTGEEIEAERFLKALADAMPYLDGGELFNIAAKRVKAVPTPRHLSPVLSVALRDLYAEGAVDLRMHGDARDAFILASDPTEKIQAFRQVEIRAGHD